MLTVFDCYAIYYGAAVVVIRDEVDDDDETINVLVHQSDIARQLNYVVVYFLPGDVTFRRSRLHFEQSVDDHPGSDACAMCPRMFIW